MNKVISFILGAAAGSLITWKVIEQKYRKLANEEIESVREYYKNREKEINRSDDASSSNENKENNRKKVEYVNTVKDLGYSENNNEEDEDYTVKIDQGEEEIAPFVIAPEEFGEAYGYETKSWTCYADLVLTDENGEIVVDPENIIGDALSHFGEYEDDSVYVRNENIGCDYEILKHDKKFSEINRNYI